MGTSLFSEVAKILLGYKLKQASLKTLIYASEYGNSRQLFAMTNECAKYQSLLEQVLKLCPKDYIQDESIAGDKELALVYLYEYLLGRKFGRNVGMRKMMLRHKQGIKKAVDQVLTQLPGARNLTDVLNGGKNSLQKIPRYMRVNLLKGNVQSAIESLQEEEWDYVGELSTEKFMESVSAMSKFQFGRDPFLMDVLVFPVATDLHNHPMTQSGILIQQDRASCVPAHVLEPPEGAVVLDCCAAPGNKTTHLASLMGDSGQVIALDRDQKRLTILKAMVEKSGASSVAPVHQDFLTLQPDSEDAKDIQYILVDPSCSGSGMRCQDDHNAASNDDALRTRLQTLKRFQISILKHALRFPAVRRVVYSTCSVFCQENEEVVTEVMAHVEGYFEFEPVLPSWPGSRGLPGFLDSSCFLRLKPENDLTQGFFVACFKRIKERETASGDASEGKDCVVEEKEKTDIVLYNDALEEETGKSSKKKKKKRDRDMPDDASIVGTLEESNAIVDNEEVGRKKKKKKKRDKEVFADMEVGEEVSDSKDNNASTTKPRKKKKKGLLQDANDKVSLQVIDQSEEFKGKRKKKKHKKEIQDDENVEVGLEDNIGRTKKNDKKRKCADNSEDFHEKKKKKEEKVQEVTVECTQINKDTDNSKNSQNEERIAEDSITKTKHKKKKKSKKSEIEI